LGDLLAEPTLMDWTETSGAQTVPALRRALMTYRQLAPAATVSESAEPPSTDVLRRRLADVWSGYQDSRFGYVTATLPRLITDAYAAVEHRHEAKASGVLALTYQLAATTLTKVGETDLAWIAADRGLSAAAASDDPVVLVSVYRAVAHALLSNGRYEEAADVVELASTTIGQDANAVGPGGVSVYGMLFLAGSMAAARADDAARCRDFLAEAGGAARRLGRDANHLWTAFGPTNVAMHRVCTAMELGDVQTAVSLGQRVQDTGLPVERRVRHRLEVARALSSWDRQAEALETLLDAERLAPEQVRYHFISRHLVTRWIRTGRSKPSYELASLAERLHVG